jgi:NAD+ synthase (glutamine-hydrolysing)
MKVALAQINTTVGAFAQNRSKVVEFYERAVAQGARVVLFPEMTLTGYPPRDLLLRNAFIEDNLRHLDQLAASLKGGADAIVGYVDRNTTGQGRPLRNSAAVIRGGKIVHRAHKILLPTYDVFDEDRYFEPAQKTESFECGGISAGVTICEDIWNDKDFWKARLYHRDPVRELEAEGIKMLANISASPWHLGKERFRYNMIRTISKTDRLPILYCNAVGGNDELIFDGHSFVLDGDGKLLGVGKGFEEDLVVVDLECPDEIKFPDPDPNQQLFKALSLGLRDYVTKCGFKSVVMGLSGGIDSALTAAIAVAALGRDHVFGVALPSRFSSEGSVVDARLLAENLGIRFQIIPIEESVASINRSLQPVFANRAEDTTEENIQSRTRGLLLMALSNKLGSMLITTGNKSELATGYCTLYGDMCGGLAVLSDLSKMQVYKLSRWINQNSSLTGLKPEVIPESSIAKAPSAELRADQKDQDTLPPYEILDQILEEYVEKHATANELAKKFDPALVSLLLRKIDLNEYKRRQAAPGLKVTSRAFGVGRRIPIAQAYSENQ